MRMTASKLIMRSGARLLDYLPLFPQPHNIPWCRVYPARGKIASNPALLLAFYELITLTLFSAIDPTGRMTTCKVKQIHSAPGMWIAYPFLVLSFNCTILADWDCRTERDETACKRWRVASWRQKGRRKDGKWCHFVPRFLTGSSYTAC